MTLESSTANLSLGNQWTLTCMQQDAGMLDLSSRTTHIVKEWTLSLGSCVLLAQSRKVLELLIALLFANMVPHWAPESVTNITLYLTTDVVHSLKCSGLFIQGVTAVIHGLLFMHLATIWVKVEHFDGTLSC